MKLAIFGATGRTGRLLLEKALAQGHDVRVLARDPSKLALQNERLTVVSGSLNDPACIEQVVSGADAVLSTLGPTKNEPTYDISRGMQQILAAMQKSGARRLIITAGAGVEDPGDAPRLFNRVMSFLLKQTAKYVYEDMLRTVDLVRRSGLDWTVVRVPMLTDDPGAGKVQVGMVGKGMGPRISRADIAEFMLQQLQSAQYVGKAPAISN